jgi:hypothetical protein
MYVIRDKKTKAVLRMHPSVPGEEAKPEEVFPDYDPAVMEFGRSDEPAIPAWFDIVKGKVVPLDPPEQETGAAAHKEPAAAEMPFAEMKETLLSTWSEQAFAKRRELIPDYQMLNAALGLYDEEQTGAIQETARAFREEFYRLKFEVEKARSRKALLEIEPKFPEKLLTPTSKSKRSRK